MLACAVSALVSGYVSSGGAGALSGSAKTGPRTAKEAIALVRAHPDTSDAASPFKRELRWSAEWRGDKWWVIGLFESKRYQRFVVDASVWKGRVWTHTNYARRPSRAWVQRKAQRWGLKSLYTRFSQTGAIDVVKMSDLSSSVEGGPGLDSYEILDAAAKLAIDTKSAVGWRFAFYVRDLVTGKRLVLTVTGPGGRPTLEGDYSGRYGFGADARLYERPPRNLAAWLRYVAKARGWR